VAQVKAWLEKQPGIETLHVNHKELLTNPAKVIARINQFLGGTLDEKQMISVIDQKLYRQRH